MKRSGTVTLLALGLVLAAASGAVAHYYYNDGNVWGPSSGGDCVHNYTETSHGRDGDIGGYSAVRTSTLRDDPYFHADCAVGWSRPPKYIRSKWHWLVFENGSWGLCKYTKWSYNPETTAGMQQWASRSKPGCGAHYYGTHGHSQTRINRTNGEFDWVGGPVWSGCHWLPVDSSKADCTKPIP